MSYRKLEIELDPTKVLAVVIYRYKSDDEHLELDVDIETVLPDEELASLLVLSARDLRGQSTDPYTVPWSKGDDEV